MRKLLLLVIGLAFVTLTACQEKLDYDDFSDHAITSYQQAETMSGNKYIVYYYSVTCEACNDVKDEILHFFDTFSELDFYLFNISLASDLSSLDEFTGTPVIMIMSNGEVYESYTGQTSVREFITSYSFIDMDYPLFDDQHLTTYDAALAIENELYIIYYYLDDCPYCNAVKDEVLPFFYSKSVEDVYFMDGSKIEDPDNIPTELIILNSGTPILLLMSNGVFLDEYYSGEEDVRMYIETIGDGELRQLTNTESE